MTPRVQRSSLEYTKVELARLRAEMEDSRAQMAKASLEKTMVELRRAQVDLAMVIAENEILMVDMNYSQVGSHRFYVQNECINLHKRKYLT